MATSRDDRFGDLLRRFRLAAGLTQEGLAECAGMSARGISDLERGARTHPQRETIRLLVPALDLSDSEQAELLRAARRPTRPRPARETAGDDAFPDAPLPFTGTPFIGRDATIETVAALLADPANRLVTLLGAGGIGKTRLAVATAEAAGPAFPNGIAFVSLAPLRDPKLVPGVVARALGGRESAVRAPAEGIAQLLRGRRILLILDNLEQLLPAAATWVAQVLAACPSLTILATSRAPLGVYGERHYPLAPLALPERTHPRFLPPLDRLRHFEAVRLFVERAQALRPDFALTDANAAAVADICARVDGLPLAIELAAAQVRMLPPHALLRRLERRLPLLTGGARTAPARQQTMRDAIAWSHDLLGRDEQTLLAWLAVFPTGCTLGAAEAVAGREGGPDVYDSIAALVDMSLLRQEDGIGGEPRFCMLETVREFGLEQLEAAGDGERARRRLADWRLALAEAAELPFPGDAMDATWLRRLDDEAPSLRASVVWLLDRGSAAAALRLLTAAQDYWGSRILDTADLIAWVSAALAAAPEAPVRDRVVARHTLAWANAFLGDYDEAERHAQAGLAAARESSDAALAGMAWFDLGMANDYRGDAARAGAAYEEAEGLLRAAGYESLAATALAELGDKLIVVGDPERAAELLDEAIARLERVGSSWGVALALGQRGFAALARGDVPLAAHRFAESIAASERNAGDRRNALGAAMGLAGVAAVRGGAARAARLLAGARAALEQFGIVTPAHAMHVGGIEAAVRAALGPEALAAAGEAGRALTLDEVLAEALALAEEASAGHPVPPVGTSPNHRADPSSRHVAASAR